MMNKIKSYTAAELIAAGAKLSKQERAGIVSDKDGVTLKWGGDYFIEWKRINTRAKLLEWLHHLLNKEWFSQYRCQLFIEKVCHHNKWKMYDGA
jgi:hypothetical protein